MRNEERWNAEFRPRIICGISDAEKLAKFSILCSVTKVVVYSLLNKRVATFTIVPYCQQIAEHSAPVIPQSIHDRIPHSAKYLDPIENPEFGVGISTLSVRVPEV